MNRVVGDLVHGMRSRERASRERQAGARGVDVRSIRDFNRLLVLNYVREHGPIPRVAIAQQTGLSRTTVSSIMDRLLEDGLVREGHTLSARTVGGRRAILVHFNGDAGNVIGVAFGRAHLTIIVANLAAEVVAHRTVPFAVEQGPDVCLTQLAEAVRQMVAECGLPWKRIVGIGIGVPSPLDAHLQVLVSPPRMPGWSGVAIRAILRRELRVPIYLDNDANMAALGECHFGAGQGVDNLAYIEVGAGIGGGLVIDGRIYRGSTGSAGEIGHVAIEEEGPTCDCGNHGCLETLAGIQAIVADARCGHSLAHARAVNPARWAAAGAPALASQASVDLAEVVQAATEGDAASQVALEHAGERIGMALSGLINLVNPSVILIDGRMTCAGEWLLEPLRRTAAARSLPVAWGRTRILLGTLGERATGLGAIATVLDAAFDSDGRDSPRAANILMGATALADFRATAEQQSSQRRHSTSPLSSGAHPAETTAPPAL